MKAILGSISKRNNFAFFFPVLILTDQKHMEEDDEYLDDPVIGILSASESKKVILKRIEHAIKLANSASFDEFSEMLKALPSLIYLKDSAGRYAFSSQSWHHLKLKGSIRGLTDFEIRKDRKNAEIARASDLEVLKSGKGKRYVIKECTDEGTDYLQVIKEPLKNDDGSVYGIIAIVNNVTDEELLRQELRENRSPTN
ncbi:MAG: hypothetical protein K6B65_00125 [Bacilli bacterium]|nr:hypothetical protein [Bacilli bacterium]